MSLDFAAFGLRPVGPLGVTPTSSAPETIKPQVTSPPPCEPPRRSTTACCSGSSSSIYSDDEYSVASDDVPPASSRHPGAEDLPTTSTHNNPNNTATPANTNSGGAGLSSTSPLPTTSHELFGSSLRVTSAPTSTLFWALDIVSDSAGDVYKHHCVRHALRLCAQSRHRDAFQIKDIPYCSLRLAHSYSEKHLVSLEHCMVRLVPRELILLSEGAHLLLTFDCLDAIMVPMLSSNTPLFAVLGTVDVLNGFKSSQLALQRVLDARPSHQHHNNKKAPPPPPLVELSGAVRWNMSGSFVLSSVLTRHFKGVN